MARMKTTRPSPAFLIAVAALVAALGGSAIADSASTSNLSSSEKKRVKRIAKKQGKKQAKKQIKKRAPGLDVDKVDGRDASELESRAFSTAVDGFVDLPTGAGTTTVATLDLPAGTYLLLARGQINNNGGESDLDVTCFLRAEGAEADVAVNLFLGATDEPGETLSASGQLVHTFATAGAATFECDTTAQWLVGNVLGPTISAISVQG